MPAGVAHVFEVIVLAARPHTLLRGHGAVVASGLRAEVQALKLHHAGIGEEETRVIPRNEGGTPHELMAALFEEI